MFKAVVIGVSAGGLQALKILLPALPADFSVPIIIVQHIDPHSDNYLFKYLNDLSAITVKEIEDKETLCAGNVYFAPAGYHLLIEPDTSVSLSLEEKVHYCRPSIDLLFESAAETYGKYLIGIILTGANADGAQGLKTIKECGGLAIAQNPKTAESPYMPHAAINMTEVDHILNLEQIVPLLLRLCKEESDVRRD
jgi:two-component system chemotaxis response regulator CheB